VSEWVKLCLLEHTSNNFEPKILFIPKTISPSLTYPNLIVQTFNKTQGNFVFSPPIFLAIDTANLHLHNKEDEGIEEV